MTAHLPTSLVGRRLTRRGALRGGGLGVAAALGGAALMGTSAQEATPAAATAITPDELAQDGLAVEILAAFAPLPGAKALKLWAPPDAGRPAWSVALDPERELVIASAFKGFVLAEYLRQVEASFDAAGQTPFAAHLQAQLAQELDLDESVFTLGSAILNPPNLTGKLTTHAALDAMILASDDTATDMLLRQIGPEHVRDLIAALGLRQTHIPDSTRQYIGYIFGDPDWQTLTWQRLLPLVNDAPYPPRPILNDEITMASTADELVAFYTRGLQGELFRHPESLALFRTILSLADAIPLIMPLGVNGFLKGGSLDAFGSHVLSVAGGVYLARRWVYFAMILNWVDAEAGSVASVVPAFGAAGKTIFTLVRDRLSV